MLLSYHAARANLYRLCEQHPDWSHRQLAEALGASLGWVEKWLKRFREELAAGKPLAQVLLGHGSARKTAPERTSAFVEEQILAIRDTPPDGLRRVPGPEAIHYYLQQDPYRALFGWPVPCPKTIYRILKRAGRIAQRKAHVPQPLPRPEPMTCWQLDFKDVSSVGAQPDGKRQHVVETLNIIDTGTSILLDAHVRPDFSAETALQALAQTLATYGCPRQITLDRDTRWVGSPMGSDFPSALLRFGACLGIAVQVCAPHHPQQNAFVERYNRTYQQECLALDRPRDLEQAKSVTETFVQHYNFQRPHQGLCCGNLPPRTAFAKLTPLPALPGEVEADGWLNALDGWHVVRKVNAHGMFSIDLKRYYLSSQLVGQHVDVRINAQDRCLQVFSNQRLIKSLPLKGLVGRSLPYETFLAHMLHQARAQARLRSLQERKYRTSALAAP